MRGEKVRKEIEEKAERGCEARRDRCFDAEMAVLKA